MTTFANWRHRLSEIPATGLKASRTATEAERARLAAELPIVSCEALSVDYRIKPEGRDRYALTGRLKAELTQSCVVTLEPVAATLNEQIDCKFVSPELIPQRQEAEQEVLSVEDLEPIEEGCIDIGRVVFEIVATSLNPYPRREGAEWQAPSREGASEDKETGPFAALAGWKKTL